MTMNTAVTDSGVARIVVDLVEGEAHVGTSFRIGIATQIVAEVDRPQPMAIMPAIVLRQRKNVIGNSVLTESVRKTGKSMPMELLAEITIRKGIPILHLKLWIVLNISIRMLQKK